MEYWRIAGLLKQKKRQDVYLMFDLGIDMGYIKNISRNILNEFMILTQPGFLQQYAGGPLRPNERDI